MRKVIVGQIIPAILIAALCIGAAMAQSIEKKIDSLFVIASSGEAKFQPLVQPAIDSIAAMGSDVAPFLVDKFGTKSARERQAITNILKKIGKPAVPFLVKSLSLRNGVVVERICGALGEIADSSATSGLLTVVNHPRWQVREQSVGSLGKTGDHRGDSAVVNALSDTIAQVRKSAAVACGQLRIAGSLPGLVHLLGDSFYGARMPAAASLTKLDTAGTVKAIMDSLNSENRQLGNLGCEILGQFATTDALDALADQAHAGTTERRSHAAIAIIKADPNDARHFRSFYLAFETDRLNLLKAESAIEALQHVDAQPK